MTVPVPDQLEFISDANGVTKDFPYPKRFLQKDEIVVALRNTDGIDTPQILGTHYTIAGSSWPTGGTVSFITAPQVPNKVVRYRMTQAKQTVDLENKQRNDAKAVEVQLDRLTMAIQDRGTRTDAAWFGLLAEIIARKAGDAALNSRVDQEITGRKNGDNALASLIGQSLVGSDHFFETQLALTFATVSPLFKIVALGGYSIAGDAPHHMMRRVASEPSHPGKRRSLDRFMPDGSISLSNGGWWELTSMDVCPEMFGRIVYAKRDPITGRVVDISKANAVSNRDAVQAAYNYLSSKGGGKLRYIPGRIYSVSKEDADQFPLVFDKDNVFHFGYGACIHRRYEPDNPFSVMRLGSFPVNSNANGRTNLKGGGLFGLEIDGGCNVQLVHNGKAYEGTTSWSAIGGALAAVGGTTQKRAFRLTTNGASCRAFQEIDTEIGKTYYVLCEVGAGDSIDWWVMVSRTNAASGQIFVVNNTVQSNGFVRFEFTAVSEKSYILVGISSTSPSGLYREFRDVRVWEKSDQDSNPLIWCSGLKRYHFKDLHVHDSRHYGVGLQNGGYEDCKINDCVIEDTYMDGLDHKNNGSVSKGNSISNLTLRRNCLKSEVSNIAASLDLSEGWTVTGISVLEFGSSDGSGAGVRCKVGEIDSSVGRGTGGRRNTISSVKIEADLQCLNSVDGIHFMNKFCSVSDFSIIQVGNGINISDQQNKASNGHIEAKGVGLLIRNKPATPSFPLTEARRNKISNVSVNGAAVGVQTDGELNELVAVEAVNNVLNYKNTGSGNRWIGGRIGNAQGSTTKQLENSQVNLVIKDCRDFSTEAYLISVAVPVDTVGSSTTYNTPHGLGYTPDVSDIQISVVRNTNTPFAAIPVIINASSTNVSWRLDTVTAGAIGSTVNVSIKIASQYVARVA